MWCNITKLMNFVNTQYGTFINKILFITEKRIKIFQERNSFTELEMNVQSIHYIKSIPLPDTIDLFFRVLVDWKYQHPWICSSNHFTFECEKIQFGFFQFQFISVLLIHNINLTLFMGHHVVFWYMEENWGKYVQH